MRADFDLHERLLGPGFAGSFDIDPLKRAFVAAAESTAREVANVRQELATLGWSIDSVANSISGLEREIAVRLDAQTQYLGQQLQALNSIDAALRSPAKVRAAERMSDAGGLLKRARHDQALHYAREAITDDPNHPGGYAAAGWAFVGLGRVDEAAPQFNEACDAAGDYQPWFEYIRWAARCYIVAGNVGRAEQLLDHALSHVVNVRGTSSADAGVLHYERALVAVAADEVPTASRHLKEAILIDTRFAKATIAEPLFTGEPELAKTALETAREIDASVDATMDGVDHALEQTTELLNEIAELAGYLNLLDEWDTFKDEWKLLDTEVDSAIEEDDANLVTVLSRLRSADDRILSLHGRVDDWRKRAADFAALVDDFCTTHAAHVHSFGKWEATVTHVGLLQRKDWIIGYGGAGTLTFQEL